jgi:hypothetical protein
MDKKEKDYIACEVDVKSIERVTKEYETVDKKNRLFENILLSANPDPIPIEAIEIDPIETTNISPLLNLEPLSRKSYQIPSEALTSQQDKLIFQPSEIENELDAIFSKIEINVSKIKYLKAQLFMLNTFYDVAFGKIPEEIQKKITDEIPSAGKKNILVPTPTFDLVDDLPCKLSELKFLLKLVSDYDRRSQGKL